MREYRTRGPLGRLAYRLYRNPAVLFGIGPAYTFVLRYRLPGRLTRDGWRAWVSAMATNAATLAVVLAMVWLVGLAPFLLVQLPITLLAATIGVWLFYVQHQFDGTVMGPRAGLERPSGGVARQFALRPSGSSCAGSRPISASITSTTWQAGSPTIAWAGCFATSRRCARSAG